MPSVSEPRTLLGVTIDRKLVVTLVLLAAGIVLAVNAPSMMPNAYVLSAAIVILNYAVLATSWNFMGGFTGYISLGHAAYFGLGAYGTALLVTRVDVPSFVAWALSGLLVAVLAVPIGFASLRVRGASFVIASIALVLITLLVFQSWSSVTGGSNGLVVPRPFPDLLRPEHHYRFYYLYLALLGAALLVWWVIDRSRFGMGLKAIREDEDKAQALGVPTFAYKLIAFVVSAFFTALGGGMYALWFGDLDPVFQFSILIGAYMVLMSLLGGRAQPVRPAARRAGRGLRPGVLQAQLRRLPVPPRRHRDAARAGRAVHARRRDPGRDRAGETIRVVARRPSASMRPREQRRARQPDLLSHNHDLEEVKV